MILNISVVRTVTNKNKYNFTAVYQTFSIQQSIRKTNIYKTNLFLSSGYFYSSTTVILLKAHFLIFCPKTAGRYNSLKLIVSLNDKPRKIYLYVSYFYLFEEVDKHIYLNRLIECFIRILPLIEFFSSSNSAVVDFFLIYEYLDNVKSDYY